MAGLTQSTRTLTRARTHRCLRYVDSRAATEFLRYVALPLGRLILLSASRLHTGRPLRVRLMDGFSKLFHRSFRFSYPHAPTIHRLRYNSNVRAKRVSSFSNDRNRERFWIR